MSPLRRPAAAFLALCALVAMGGCDSPTQPTPVAPPPFVPPVVPPGPPDLTGSYTLTIEIPDACEVLPVQERRRQYVATVAKVRPDYFTVDVVGAGYAERTFVGRIWYPGVKPPVIDWNNSDDCDGSRESLPRGDTLLICAYGDAVVDDSSIVATIWAGAIVNSADRRTTCAHPFSFTFLRQ